MTAGLVATLLGNAAFLTSSAVLLGFGRLDQAGLAGAAMTGLLVGIAAVRMVARAQRLGGG